MSKFCSECGQQGCKIHVNGAKEILRSEIKHQTQLGEKEHQSLDHKIKSVTTEVKNNFKLTDINISELRKYVAGNNKFILVMVVSLISIMAATQYQGDELNRGIFREGLKEMDDKFHKEMNPRIEENSQANRDQDNVFKENNIVIYGNHAVQEALLNGDVRLTTEIEADNIQDEKIQDLQNQINDLKGKP